MHTYQLTPIPQRKYKVIQWFTGQIAKDQIRMIHDIPSLELVGAVCWHKDKEGLDVGRIAGIGDIGVKASCDEAAALSMDADIVLLNPLTNSSELPLKILRSGKNLISIMGPWNVRADPAFTDIDRVAREHGVSMLGTGNFPGLINDFLPTVVSGFLHDVRSIRVIERMYNGANTSANVLHGIIGFGLPLAEHSTDSERGRQVRAIYRGPIHQAHYTLAEALGMVGASSRFETSISTEVVPAPDDILLEKSGLLIKKGTVAGVRFTIVSSIDGRLWQTMVAERNIALGIAPGWLQRLDQPEWEVRIEADPGMYLEFGTLDRNGQRDHDGVLTLNAARLVNLIPAVVAARPGHLTYMDLPIVTSLR